MQQVDDELLDQLIEAAREVVRTWNKGFEDSEDIYENNAQMFEALDKLTEAMDDWENVR